MLFRVSRIFMLILGLTLMNACGGGLSKHGELFAELMRHKEGVFRGVVLGDTRDFVRKHEGIEPMEELPGALNYSIRVGESGTCYIHYGFEKDFLYEIMVDGEFSNQEEGKALLEGFKSYFTEKYGNYAKESGYLVWRTKGRTNDREVTIELVDESEFIGFGQWSLSIYDYKAIEIESPIL
jgi:hypothetical protein